MASSHWTCGYTLKTWHWQLEAGQIAGAEPDGMAAILKADVKYEVPPFRQKRKSWTEM